MREFDPSSFDCTERKGRGAIVTVAVMNVMASGERCCLMNLQNDS